MIDLRRLDWNRHRGPMLVWMLGWVAFFALLFTRSAGTELVGVSRGRVTHVSAPMAARIKAVLVRPADVVKRGQVVALLDDSAVVGQIHAVQAESARLKLEHDENRSLLEAEIHDRAAGWAAEDREFGADLAQLQLTIAELRTILESEALLVESLRMERETARTDLEAGLVSRVEYDRIAFAHESAAAKVKATERALQEARSEQERALALRESYQSSRPQKPSPALASEHADRAIRAQDALAEELESLREQHVLRAPCDGVVVDLVSAAGDTVTRRPGEAVLREPGEVIGAGEAVLAIAESRPTEIVAYVPEHKRIELRPGSEVEVVAVGRPSVRSRTKVRAVIPTIERLPERLWIAPNVPAWGRPVLLDVPESLELLPGEMVRGWRR